MRRNKDNTDALVDLDGKPSRPQRERREKSVGPRGGRGGTDRPQVDRSGQATQYKSYQPKRTYKSKYQEFMAAEWRYHRNEININEETVVPALPTKPNQEPNDGEYHKF